MRQLIEFRGGEMPGIVLPDAANQGLAPAADERRTKAVKVTDLPVFPGAPPVAKIFGRDASDLGIVLPDAANQGLAPAADERRTKAVKVTDLPVFPGAPPVAKIFGRDAS